MKEKLNLSDGINLWNITFAKKRINLLNAPPSCGKSFFIYNFLLKDPVRYLKGIKSYYVNTIYLVDTNALKEGTLEEIAKIKLAIKDSDRPEDILLYENLKSLKVMTYSAFGKFRIKRDMKGYIIICDEFQNNFDYTKFNNNDGVFEGEYIDILKKWNTISKTNYVIALSGTDSDIFRSQFFKKFDINIKPLISATRYKKLKSYNYKPLFTNNIYNIIKQYDFKIVEGKVLIFVKYRRDIASIQQILKAQGVSSIGIWSKNNSHKMNSEQLRVRNILLKENHLPKEYKVVILTSAYETGINLENIKDQDGNLIYNEVQTIFILCDTFNMAYQMRFRIRHDIKELYIALCTNHYTTAYEKVEDDLKLLDGLFVAKHPIYENTKIIYNSENDLYTEGNNLVKVQDFCNFEIPNKFIATAFKPKLKQELKQIYDGYIPLQQTIRKSDTTSYTDIFANLINRGYSLEISPNKELLLFKSSNPNNIKLYELFTSNLGIKLGASDKQLLCELLDCNIDTKTVNNKLKEINFPYQINSVPIHGKRYWIPVRVA